MSSLDDAIKEAYASAPSNVVILDTLEISHPDIEEPIYLVRDRADFVATLETDEEVTFVGTAFRMSLPATGENGIQDLSLSIDNSDRRVSDFVNTVKTSLEPVEVKYRPYLSNDPSMPQMNPPLVLWLKHVSVTVLEINAKATFMDIINKNFPSQNYTRKRFPSLGQS